MSVTTGLHIADSPLPAHPGEFVAYGDILTQSLFFDPDRVDVWLDRAGRQNVRVVRVGGAVAGGLAIYPCGQFFGGRRLECAAIAAVAVAPEFRASGAGTCLMRETVAEQHEKGVPLACLFPATQPVYRNAGFERAGLSLRYRLRTADIDLRDREPAVRPVTPDDAGALRDLYASIAGSRNGWLDRPEILWKRHFDPLRKAAAYAYLVEGDAEPEGYVSYSQVTDDRKRHQVEVHDIQARTPRAARRLFAFFASQRSIIETVDLPDSPAADLLGVLRENDYEVTRHLVWFLRIAHVVSALEGRGYAPGLQGELHLDVHDDLLPANSGRFVLRVQEGRGSVETGGRGDLRLDVRGLAALFTGHAAADQVRLAGRADGAPEILAGATALFAGPAPWMPDMF